MVTRDGRDLYVGLNDKAEEGIWRFPTDGTRFDPTYDGSVFKWDSGEPNNSKGDEHCAYVRSNQQLNDGYCSGYIHGLCEVKYYDCI